MLDRVVSPKTLNIILGPLAQKNLPRANDDVFGLYWDKTKGRYTIGESIIGIDYDYIIINDKKYKESHGLWRLLTYTEEDFKNYSRILLFLLLELMLQSSQGPISKINRLSSPKILNDLELKSHPSMSS